MAGTTGSSGLADGTTPGAESTARLDAVDRWIGAGLLGVAFAWFALSYPYGLELRDEGYLYGLAAQVAAGEVPHRDFRDIYGPGTHWTTAALLALADGRILGVRMALALLKACAVAITYALGRRVASRPLALAGSALAIAYWGRAAWKLDTPYASMFSIPLALMATRVLLGALARGGAGRFAAAGALAGSVVLFKQSIGVMVVFGSGLAVLAAALLTPRDVVARARPSAVLLAAWASCAAAVLIPFAAYLSWRDYAVHLLPLHFGMVLIGGAALRWGGGADPAAVARRRLLPLAAGVAAPLAVVALLYVRWGALARLVEDMFLLPQRMTNYYEPVTLPGPIPLAWWLAAVALVSAALLAVSGRRRAAVALAIASGVVALPVAVRDGAVGSLVGAPDDASGLVSAALVTVCFASCAGALRDGAGTRDGSLIALVTLAIFQSMLVVQIYPKAGFKILILQAAMVPLAIGVLARWSRLAGAEARRRHPWRVAACLLPVPMWMAWPAAAPVLALHAGGNAVHTLPFPATAGLRIPDGEYRDRRMADFERLVAHLRDLPDPRAPLLLLSNQAMILHLSGHPSLFADRQLELSFVGWDRVPHDVVAREIEPDLIARLRDRPDARVIERAVDAEDRTPRAFRVALPRLHAELSAAFREVARFGVYRVLRRSPAPETGPRAGAEAR